MFELEDMIEEKKLIELAVMMSVAEVTGYAQSRGWKPLAVVKRDILVFYHRKYESKYGFRQLVIPQRKTDDYAKRIFEVLRILEECEGRAIRNIVSDMRKRRKIGFSYKARVLPFEQWRSWQWKPEFSKKFGCFAWLFIWLNFSWEYDD